MSARRRGVEHRAQRFDSHAHAELVYLPHAPFARNACVVGLPPRRHFLHAAWLLFRHPITGEPMDLRSPLPSDLETSLATVAGQSRANDRGISKGDGLEEWGFYRVDD